MRLRLIACFCAIGLAGVAMAQINDTTTLGGLRSTNVPEGVRVRDEAALGASQSITNEANRGVRRRANVSSSTTTNEPRLRQNEVPESAERALFNAPTSDDSGRVRDMGPGGAKSNIGAGSNESESNRRNTGSSPVTPLNR